ncbi:arabinan endo-1,5-alpha-L-arabinosidase [Flavobacterium caeni]|uniref:Arabinan endo-1,5-alpha-L-arabinosidase n=1 Tax=Flavobacterium caeni TaxID=490189 RepID=A0A1G5GCM7_9FLAO|nr:arabinan endo-1,5-alpha-L-arabinosidase [Flavobacterium caeni]SCY49039.1 arabinan endo-1,5-alpha-L-arabinosidase [Flavobacterium caeni]
MKRLLSITFFALLIAGCSGDENTATVPVTPTPPEGETFPGPTYADNYTPLASWNQNSQWNLANVHDPTVVKQSNYFYMYQTDASYGNAHDGHGHFFARRSTDLVNWEYMGSTMAAAPAWVKDSMNAKRARMEPALPPIDNPNYGYWAPCVRKIGNVYRMYYSIVISNPIVGTSFDTSWSERAFIGLAECTDLAANVWVDKGMVICSEPDGVESYIRSGPDDWSGYFKFNAIDPSVIEVGAQQYLIYGSWHTGIAAVELDPTTGKPFQLQSIADYGTRIAGRGNLANNRWQGLEAPEIIYNPDTGYYYLFLAYDELGVAYNTRVARSQSIYGPYIGIDGGNVSEGAECWPMVTHPYKFNNHTGWVGIAHCAIFQDDATGKWYYSSQGRLPENVPGINVSNAVMMGQVREIQWTPDGWPVANPERYAAVPQTDLVAADFVGAWEQITMQYQYRVQQTSVTLQLRADGTYTLGGIPSGNWSYDAATKVLSVGSVQSKVWNAWNWEASPRKRTLTFSGYTAGGQPVWGKKVN